jgi:localization factor PodJL
VRLAVLLGLLAIGLDTSAQGGRFPAEVIAPGWYHQAIAAERDGKTAAAVPLYIRAAEAGNASAALRLADIYEKGAAGVPRNHEEAFRWRNAATLLDSRESPGSVLYRHAMQAESDGRNAEAVRLYVQAARAGSGRAAWRLSQIYDKGLDGVSRDYPESLKWRNAARVLGEGLIGDFPNPRPR